MRSRLIAAVIVGSVALVSCGGGDSPPLDLDSLPPEPTTTTTPPAASTVPPSSVAGTGAPATGAPVTTGAAEVRTWVPATGNLAGLSSECGNMSYVTARPDRDELIAGIALQGLWSSTDGAASWTPLGQGSGSDRISNRPSSIVFDPDTPSTFWESGIYGEGGGVYRTDDDGATFDRLGDITGSDLVSVDLTDPARGTLLAMRHETSVVLRSTDGGDTWDDISVGLPDDVGQAVGPHIIDAQTYLLGTKASAGSGVFRTTDGGQTWTRVFQGGINGRPAVTSDDGALFWLLDGGGIIRSDDAGETWTPLTVSGVGRNAISIFELPDGRLATYGSQVLVSDASRTTFLPVGPPVPYEPNGLAYSPFRKAFYVWRFDCAAGDNPIAADAIMQVPFDYETE